jgi:hypothetical protein
LPLESKHDQHEERTEWRGPLDPGEFDEKKATSEMRKAK